MSTRPTRHRVVVLALDDVVVADLVLPSEVLGRTRLADGSCPYEVLVSSHRARVDAGLFTLRTPWRLDALTAADTIVVPGRNNPFAPTPGAVINALRAGAARGARIVSICVGAFILAEAGLLEGREATTHWAAATQLAERYPTIHVNDRVLFVDDGQILTSAGAAAGFDVLLHLIQRDHGQAVAANTARALVMPLTRQGGQAQYISPPARPVANTGLGPVLEWLEANHHRPLTLTDIARTAAMSTRTLNRRFRQQTGTSPAKWLCHIRIRRAQALLEATDEKVETIAHLVGLGSPANFREQFTRQVGTSPSHYRNTFRTEHPTSTPPSTTESHDVRSGVGKDGPSWSPRR